jgi:flagellar biosynthesis protein FlhF
MMRSLLDSGFSPALARELTEGVADNATDADAHKAVSAEIERRLPLSEEEALVEQGGVYALVGPTGVGKTTTVAKLAARCVVRHGAASLALLTTDSYRIAAHDQLRVYGKILNAPVHAIKDAHDLKITLSELRGKRTILIDTIGMSQRDRLVAEQTALLTGCGAPVKRLLLLNATANAATLDEVIGAYARGGIHGCIISKVDESASIATALDCAIRHRLAVHYVTNGQRVPEDLHLPNRTYLLHRALRPVRDSATHSLRPDEFSLVMAGLNGAAAGAGLGAVHG